MSTQLKDAPEQENADLTSERQLEHIQRLDRQCASLYEMFSKLSDRIDALENKDEPCT